MKRHRSRKVITAKIFSRHLNIYYAAVVACIRDAEFILIFGPGEAKGELKKRLERINLGGRIVGIETVDKMTGRQIAAKVRQYFKEKGGQQKDLDGTT